MLRWRPCVGGAVGPKWSFQIPPVKFPLVGPIATRYTASFVARGLRVPRRDCFATGLLRSPPRAENVRWHMANPFQFLQEVRGEAKKITWPTRRETMITTGLVIAMVIVASIFFVVVDWVLRFGVGLLLRVGQ